MNQYYSRNYSRDSYSTAKKAESFKSLLYDDKPRYSNNNQSQSGNQGGQENKAPTTQSSAYEMYSSTTKK
ncbi:hypothetical protein CAEBREN_19111 [Caenorhabditis brenneri]|uniref:Uncharacterized protein n=1 Tax=Caenorhabditis brenneri TaxID=135651 RepID=G0PGZ9_CAEBE|nr:hypothetical protein CAEBREN_19111 [Caenorhabditis brenneri]